ncbi:NlpC/P60 family protein [Streptomyces bambusae]|uniref:C40 family peptidase n=1 Tax=Streptomyces bambusae TaxID=1550616 RepID=UPI001CFD4167|nr:C40 family peptidase [Streptomyces bambusae]MCB5168718.1 NlpC/P60 family protein [Streptomyces bambusae]
MSHTAHIPSHRKPRRSASKLAVRAGVAGGVLSTLAMAGPASAAPSEPVTETLEMPVLNMDLAADVSSALTQSADAAQARALDTELAALETSAEKSAATDAKKAKVAAVEKAEVEAQEAARQAEADRKDAERASRSAARSTLGNGGGNSSSADDATRTDSGAASASKGGGTAASIVNFALAQVGKAYVRGATGPSAYDCSGLVQAAYRAAGITLPRISYEQSSRGTAVSLSNLQPGDVLYWGGRSNSYHVAIYVGGGQYVGAQNPSAGVAKHSLDWDRPSGAVRIL